jgi:hypothetical protein
MKMRGNLERRGKITLERAETRIYDNLGKVKGAMGGVNNLSLAVGDSMDCGEDLSAALIRARGVRFEPIFPHLCRRLPQNHRHP